MKKRIKKMTLNRETIRSLEEVKVAGGWTGDYTCYQQPLYSECMCTHLTQCDDGCW